MGEDQERFEDYLELEQFITELQAGHIAHPPQEMTPEQARVYRMAALFRSASPEAAEPRPEFAAELQAKLEQALHQPTGTPATQNTQNIAQKPQNTRKLHYVSRRALFAGSAAAVAASLAIGAGVDRLIEQSSNTNQPANPNNGVAADTPLIAANVTTIWHPAATLAQLAEGAVLFVTGSIVGYVVRDNSNQGQIIAMSAACTHMGCIVNWEGRQRKFYCPCHGGVFTENGGVDQTADYAGVKYLRPLPQLQTKIEHGKVYVEVPAPQNDPTTARYHHNLRPE